MPWFPCGGCGSSPFECYACNTGTRPDQIQWDISGVADSTSGCGSDLTDLVNGSHVLDFYPFDSCNAVFQVLERDPGGCELVTLLFYPGGTTGFPTANWVGQLIVTKATTPPAFPVDKRQLLAGTFDADCSSWTAVPLGFASLNDTGLDFSSATITVTSL